MNGSSLPYHLRTNKVIERKIFFDLLFHLNTELPRRIQEYKYFSMGGPMLEDHHLLHHELGMKNLVSIERDRAALDRQMFNRPFACIECRQQDSAEFAREFDESAPSIVWLDFTDTKWSAQLTSCYDLLLNLKPNDIFKVTFNANPDVLKKEGMTKSEYFKRKANCKWLSENLIENDVQTMPNFAATISSMVKDMAQDALGDEGVSLKVLTEFRYIDNTHQMFTLCGILIENDDTVLLDNINRIKSNGFPYLVDKNSGILEIAVPILTQKEKFEINSLLPSSGEGIDIDKIPFLLDRSSARAEAMLRNYVEYYRYIPNFQKMAI